MRSILPLRAVAVAALAILVSVIVWASLASDVWTGLRELLSNRWGVATLVDLYCGALVVFIWICACERRWWARVLWGAALLGLGHGVSLLFVLVRLARARAPREAFGP